MNKWNDNWITHISVYHLCLRDFEKYVSASYRYPDVIYISMCLNSFIRQRVMVDDGGSGSGNDTIARHSSSSSNVKSFIFLLGRMPWHWLILFQFSYENCPMRQTLSMINTHTSTNTFHNNISILSSSIYFFWMKFVNWKWWKTPKKRGEAKQSEKQKNNNGGGWMRYTAVDNISMSGQSKSQWVVNFHFMSISYRLFHLYEIYMHI